MTTSLSLSQISTDLIGGLGGGLVTGTFSGVTSSTAIDTTRFDKDNTWDSAYIWDTTSNWQGRISQWIQGTNTFNLFGTPTASTGDAYILSPKLSFPEIYLSINNGITFAGKMIRQYVRDESQQLTTNIYQYTPNYVAGSTNSFFIGGVEGLSYEYWTGQATRDFVPIPRGTDGGGWYMLDDQTIQLPQQVVDAFSGNPLRISGYGPVFRPVVTSSPGFILASFIDDEMVYTLEQACLYQAWLIQAAKVSGGERSPIEFSANVALRNYTQAMKNWKRPMVGNTPVILPTTGSGWRSGRN